MHSQIAITVQGDSLSSPYGSLVQGLEGITLPTSFPSTFSSITAPPCARTDPSLSLRTRNSYCQAHLHYPRRSNGAVLWNGHLYDQREFIDEPALDSFRLTFLPSTDCQPPRDLCIRHYAQGNRLARRNSLLDFQPGLPQRPHLRSRWRSCWSRLQLVWTYHYRPHQGSYWILPSPLQL